MRDRDQKLLFEAYNKKVLKESTTHHMTMSDLVDGIENCAKRLAGVFPRDHESDRVTRNRLVEIYHELSDIVEMYGEVEWTAGMPSDMQADHDAIVGKTPTNDYAVGQTPRV